MRERSIGKLDLKVVEKASSCVFMLSEWRSKDRVDRHTGILVVASRNNGRKVQCAKESRKPGRYSRNLGYRH